ncbi:endonuclease [Roseobacter denitrificans]|uniref:endonuclease/exonuclease/phosphatase family protein n=1 Tax=Roseobacter denitrificans TaxID=2434 RepID=UPI00032320A1|nr:endonuclease/exonuclease/phosphatase family protein [Roseobacter denitrificans]AVL53393.1 endonuclease [Roseobacter denitrificans]
MALETDLTGSEKKPLRVLSWNVFNENPDPARIAEALATLNPDIALLQEALPAHIDEIKASFPHVSVARDYALKGELCHLVIASRFPTRRETTLFHADTSKPAPTRWARHAGWVEFLDSLSVDVVVPGTRPFRVVNLHTSAGVSPSVRQAELAETQRHFDHEGPCLVAGDFNSYAVPWLAPLLAIPLHYRPKDWLIFERRALNAWFRRRGFAPALHGVTFPKFRLQMDQVFTRDIMVETAAIERRLWGSDHRPILLDISV